MDARIFKAALVAISVFFTAGASYRTPNFVVQASSDRFAKQVGDTAEAYRRELALLWLGKELPRWAQPCPIRLEVGEQLGAGGATSFVFDRGEVFNWQMTIQGSEERILDSVLPHEVTHTIFASHFRQPLPRWADEGACTTVEHESERKKQERMLIQFLQTNRGIAFSQMFAMREYPPDVMPLYSQGYSLSRFLIQQGGRRKFMQFVHEGLRQEQWGAVTRQMYGYGNLAQLQEAWLKWVKDGCPTLGSPDDPAPQAPSTLLASATAPVAAQPPAPAAQAASTAAPAASALASDQNPYRAVSASNSSAPVPASLAPSNPSPVPAAASGPLPGPAMDAQVASAAPRDDWQARGNRGAAGAPPARPSEAAPPAGKVASDPRVRSAVTRPQTPETPRQIILEWSRGTGPAPQQGGTALR